MKNKLNLLKDILKRFNPKPQKFFFLNILIKNGKAFVESMAKKKI